MATANIRLRVLRAERGLSQMDVAERAGMTQNRYWRIENGYPPDPSADERKALAAVFAIDESDDAFREAVAS